MGDPLSTFTPGLVTGMQVKQAMENDPNPFTFAPFSEEYKRLLLGRQKLRIYEDAMLEGFYKTIQSNQVVLVTGETGSGKTTQIPQLVAYADLSQKKGKVIACTYPPRVGIAEVAERLAAQMDLKAGKHIGFATPYEEVIEKGTTFIKCMTDAVLLREARRSQALDDYSAIIIDEVNDRSLSTDVLMVLLKGILKQRPDLKVILILAPGDLSRIRKFFAFGMGNVPHMGSPGGNGQRLPPIFKWPSVLYPVDVVYTTTPEQDYISAAVRTVLGIHLNEGPGDILLFLPSVEDIEHVCRDITVDADRLIYDDPQTYGILSCMPIYPTRGLPIFKRIWPWAALNPINGGFGLGGTFPPSSPFAPPIPGSFPGQPGPFPGQPGQYPYPGQSNGIDSAPPLPRRVIITTSIADAPFGVEGVRITYVVDAGFLESAVYNPRIRVESQFASPASKAQAQERAKCAGRAGPGKCFRLFTENDFIRQLDDHTFPEIARLNLAGIMLEVLALGVKDLVRFSWYDAPPPESAMRAMEMLNYLGAVDHETLTPLGTRMAEFPLEPQLAKFLIVSAEFGCSEEVLTIVSMLSVPDVWLRPESLQAKADTARAALTSPDGEHLTLLNVYNNYIQNIYDKNWPSRNFVSRQALMQAQQIRKHLHRIMDRLELDMVSADHSRGGLVNVRKALVASFFMQTAQRAGSSGGYVTMKDNQVAILHPSCKLKRRPDWVIYHQCVLASNTGERPTLRVVTEVRPEWLLEFAGDYVDLNSLPAGEAKRALQRTASTPSSRTSPPMGSPKRGGRPGPGPGPMPGLNGPGTPPAPGSRPPMSAAMKGMPSRGPGLARGGGPGLARTFGALSVAPSNMGNMDMGPESVW